MDGNCVPPKPVTIIQSDWITTPEGENFFRKFCTSVSTGRRLFEVVQRTMSGNLDSQSLLAVCLLLLRRRRRRMVQENREAVVRRDVVRENREAMVRRDIVRENLEPVFQQIVMDNHEPMDGHYVLAENQERSVGQNAAQEPEVPKASAGSRANRKWWVHPSLADVTARTHCKLFHDGLREDPDKFYQHYKVSIDCFYDILARIEKSITRTDTFMREAVDPETRLAVTLRYLSTGSPYRAIAEEFNLGRSTVSLIARNVGSALWEVLRSPYIGEPSVEEFLKISEDYHRKTDFPHCLGSVGGRYVRVRQQKGAVNDLFVFPKYHAVAVVALVDSNFYFRFVDVSGYRQENDLFKATTLGARVFSKSLSLPQPEKVANFPEPLPYVFVSNDFFGSDNVLRPFRQKKFKSPAKTLFNNKMEKAMAPLDSALTLLTNRWRILQRPFEMSVEGTESVLKACCVLHNYLGDHEGFPPVGDLARCSFDRLEPGPKTWTSGGVRSLFVNFFSCASSAKEDEKEAVT